LSYPAIYKPGHHLADYVGYVPIHKLVMEQRLGRRLRQGEIIHHKDWDKRNPHHSNLYLTTRKIHQRIPLYQGRFLAECDQLAAFFDWLPANQARLDKYWETMTKLIALENATRKERIRNAGANSSRE